MILREQIKFSEGESFWYLSPLNTSLLVERVDEVWSKEKIIKSEISVPDDYMLVSPSISVSSNRP